jgi:hypothetical protein
MAVTTTCLTNYLPTELPAYLVQAQGERVPAWLRGSLTGTWQLGTSPTFYFLVDQRLSA